MNRGDPGDTCTGGVSRVFTGESGVRVTFKVLDSLSTAPRHAVNQAPQASGPGTHASGVARSPPVGGARSHGSAWFNRVENPEPISMATSDAFVARGMSSDIDPAHVYSRDIDPEPKYEDAVDSLSKDDRARTYMVAHAFFRSFSVVVCATVGSGTLWRWQRVRVSATLSTSQRWNGGCQKASVRSGHCQIHHDHQDRLSIR